MSQSQGVPASRRWDDLKLRAGSAFVLVAAAVVTARLGGHLFTVFWLATSIVVLWEWQRLIDAAALGARLWVGVIALILVALLAHLFAFQAFVVLLCAAIALGTLGGPGRRFWAAAGMLYAGFLVLSTIGLRFSFPFGSRSIFWLFATVWSTDVAAYFGGRLFGGPKLWPRISPSKTWSGTLVGLAVGSLFGTFIAVRDLPGPTAVVPIFFVTLAASFFSQLGDAAESLIKRRFGVKDSSSLIPGHGGVMDRIDGFITAATFAFCLGLVRNLPTIAGGIFYWA